MSRMMKVVVALLAIAMIAAPAFAEDRLSLSGSYDIYGLYTNNTDLDDSANDSTANFDQRFRLGGTIAVAEGVAIKFRADIVEGDYSDAGYTATTFDDAYIQWDTDMLTAKAGIFYTALGKGIASEDRSSGFGITLKGNVPVTFVYQKEAEGADAAADPKDNDVEVWLLQVEHKTDMYGAKVFAAYENNEVTANMNQYLIGTSFDFNLGAVFLTGEFDVLGGDAGANVDAEGLQLFLDASTKLSETLTLGGMFFYAKGNDSASETQIHHISDQNAGWGPQEYGPNSTDFGFITSMFDYTADFGGGEAGVIAGSIYVDTMVNDDLQLTAQYTYATPEEDGGLAGVDYDASIVTLGSKYNLFTNTTLASSLHYIDIADGDDPAIGAITYLSVKF